MLCEATFYYALKAGGIRGVRGGSPPPLPPTVPCSEDIFSKDFRLQVGIHNRAGFFNRVDLFYFLSFQDDTQWSKTGDLAHFLIGFIS